MGFKTELFVLESDKTFQTTGSPGKALKIYHSTCEGTALPKKPVPVVFPCQNYRKPNESYSVQLTAFPKNWGKKPAAEVWQRKG